MACGVVVIKVLACAIAMKRSGQTELYRTPVERRAMAGGRRIRALSAAPSVWGLPGDECR